MHQNARWFFDFVSPFSYLQFRTLHRLPESLELTLTPVLFAGLLAHWGQKGPAEISPKRVDTYRYCQWLADRLGVAFQMPKAHPFNPLPYLRLCLSLGGSRETIGEIFDYIWTQGAPVHTEAGIQALADRLQVENLPDLVGSQSAKQQLRANTNEAIAEGVYGVPTFVVGTERFWGIDQMEMLCDWLATPDGRKHIATEHFSALPSGL
jgi:2-hydroxychromene-2-carboxylate isomerase